LTGPFVSREDFPALLSYRAYLNTAAIGLSPRHARDMLLARVADYFLDSYGWEGRTLEELEAASRLLHDLYGFDPARVAIGESTTHMIVRAATALAGDGVIGLSEHEFPGIVVALRSACRSLGCRVRLYRGAPEEALEEAARDGARVLVGSTVYWVTGHRLDTGRVVAAARRHGAGVVLDAIQQLGGVPVVEGDLEADALCAASKKWLLAPHSGLAVCHLSGRMLEEAEPAWYGLNNADIPDKQAYWASPDKDLEGLPALRGDGHRFTAPSGIQYLQAHALRATLEYLAGLDWPRGYRHVLELARRLADLAVDAGFEPLPEHPAAGIVLVRTGLPHEREAGVARRLRASGIAVSHRGQAGIHGIRASVHVYNSEEDVDLFVEYLRRLARG